MAGNPFGTSDCESVGALQPAARGGFVPSRIATVGDSNAEFNEAHAAFSDFVMRQAFPCLGARAAVNSESYALAVYDRLGADTSTANLARDLYEFTRSKIRRTSEYATFVAVFRDQPATDELAFERLMWSQLAQLNRADAEQFEWDSSVQADPTDPQFSFSFAGQALYVIGMHPNSSREARRFRWPTMIFNPHEQFERLRQDGKWLRMQETIRDRDRQLQGSINPMLSDFGTATEARQYSGRAVEEDWKAPFEAAKRTAAAGKCPFHH